MGEGDSLIGKLLLGKLEVVRRLGGGGMGVVYEVEHRLTGHRRALKVVRPQYAERPRFMKRLMREAKVAGTLGSDYVVETYDAGRLEDGSAYVLMELLDGRNLYEVIQEEGTIDPPRLGGIMVQVTEGVAAAHDASIIHRDLKPENVFLVDDDGVERVKILDFGVSKFEASEVPISRLTAEGTLVGTPYYMSPEQAGGRAVDARSDVYALGVMMYEALAGRLPYEASTVGELFVKIGAGQCVPLTVRRPDLDPRWSPIVHRAFHADPEARYQSAEDLRRALLPLARSAAAARAKTISDGVRATLDYADEPLPPPAPLPDPSERPTEDGATVAAISVKPPSVRREPPPAEPAPPASDAAPRTASRAPWVWAIAGAVAVVLVILPLRSWLASQPPDGSPSVRVPAEESARAPEPETPTAPAPPTGEDDALAAADPADAGAGATTTPARRGRSRATAAGLDPNPYR